nr:zinc finger, CCHC-type [Tanacetum cinerariifolium]
PTPLGEINALYRIDGSSKHFSTLRQILHMVDRQDLMKLYGLVGERVLVFGKINICGRYEVGGYTLFPMFMFYKKEFIHHEGTALLRVEMVINSPWIMPILGTKELASPEQTAPVLHVLRVGLVINPSRYVVPTGRVIVPTGRYVVPTGRVIVATGRYVVPAAVAAIKNMASNFSKLDKFEEVDFRRWPKKLHFLLSRMSVMYALSTPIPEDADDATVEQLSHLRIEESPRLHDSDKPKVNNVVGP